MSGNLKVAVIQIGNTDNKLTQYEWSQFAGHADSVIRNYATNIHFCGGSSWDSPYQNACWVIEFTEHRTRIIRDQLSLVAKQFDQESIAFTTGETEFIRP